MSINVKLFHNKDQILSTPRIVDFRCCETVTAMNVSYLLVKGLVFICTYKVIQLFENGKNPDVNSSNKCVFCV